MKRIAMAIMLVAAQICVWAAAARAGEPMEAGASGNRANSGFDQFLWNGVLRKHVDDHGLVDYAGIKESPSFRAYVTSLAATSVEKLGSDNDKLAYWINAYNALTIHAVLQTLPADQSTWHSYKITEQKVDGKSIWKGIKFDVGGGRWTLDEIEHSILRKMDGLRDPRIHVALVCAAKGCPPLWDRAYTGEGIELQLASAMKRFMSNPKQCVIDARAGSIRISKVFEWYGADFADPDFEPHAATIPKFLASYSTGNARKLKDGEWDVSFLDYDWSLNIQK